METFEKLKEAKQLFDSGILNEEEYQKLKARLLDEMDKEHSAANTGQTAVPAQPASGSTAPAPAPAYTASAAQTTGGASTGMKILSFLIPLVGLILFIMDRDRNPEAAKDELLWAGIGFAVGIILYIIAVAGAASTYY